MRRLWALVATAAVLPLCVATPADAHTTLEQASPGIGATVSSPTRIVLTYADPVIVPQVILTDATGGRHESGRAQAVDNKVTQQVGGPLPPGVYKVGWRVVATDGHPVSGEYGFTVRGAAASRTGEPAGGASPGAAPAAATPGSTVSTVAAPDRSSSGSGWWWIALGIALVAAAGGAIALARRRAG
jgi:methionine-rich copper-binding protein CopC